ncbi:AAA domain-containing protein [Hydrogenibacillus sp. N12]|uniref:DEAD/DEAH box helicase n=1 Tax=Hydrogenibacillus sp. N12 TaxID=2866627 RepID=UPI001C7D3509|nr:AAA domain-containing protein [Hydrogenibacillus sp. N12]QZA33225.1 hypothetical protein K2M58_01265 [Hydrogenibacillus sp. N12]
MDQDSGERRIDLRSKEGEMEVVRLLHPRYFPQGSWPSDYSLVRSQQFAVNALWNHLTSKRGGLFAVNGPPGTGKTTLLRDIVAAVVVDRAKILSKYDDPRKIFLPKRKYDENEPPYYPIQHLDHAIVVASSNNGAVENVTLELPKTDAVANNFVNQAAYFQELATALLQSAEKQSSVSKAWGLIAARLGKKENRDQFIQIVLEKRPALQRSEVSAEAIGLIHRLKEISDGKRSPEKSWSEVVKTFEEALRKEQAHRTRIAREAEILNHYLDVRRSIRNQMRQIQEYKERISKLEQEIEQLKNRRSQLEVDIQRRRDAWLLHKRRKPGWLETLRTFGRSYRRWRHELKELEAEYRERFNLEEKLIADLREKEKAWKEEQIKLGRAKSQCRNSIQHMKEYKDKIKKLKSILGNRIPLRDGSIDAAKAELQAPWADEDWLRARIEVFLRALELHQAFIENAADQMWSNLILVKRWLSGKTLPADGLKTALETLGLVVPVVSTTFASFPRMFRDFAPHSVGWLLIDEAGQARPQEAAGALWRAKRVVVVGDPLQLEPVVTLPKRIVAAFGKIFDVEGDWWPTHASVQSLADRSMIYGTKLKQLDGREVWVGAPLRVHRRCDNPMFSIINRLSYNDMMVWGRKPSTIQLPESGWIDVPFSGRIDSRHFIPEEGEALKKLLSILIKCYKSFDPKDVYIISPFRDVVRRSSPVSCVNCPLRRMKGQVTQAFTTCSMAGSVDFCCSFFHCQYSSIFR